jgi:hypothetical protein
VGGLADHVHNPSCATAVGLVLYARRNVADAEAVGVGSGTFAPIFGRLRNLFKEFF